MNDQTVLFQLTVGDFKGVADERGIKDLSDREFLFLKNVFVNAIPWTDYVGAAFDVLEQSTEIVK